MGKTRLVLIYIIPIFLFSCTKRTSVDGIRIDGFYQAMESYQANKKVCDLVSGTLKKDPKALADLINYPCGYGTNCYDLGFIVSQIVFKMSEKEFMEVAAQLEPKDQNELSGLISVGLEYGDHDFPTSPNIAIQFPRLDSLLSSTYN